MIKIEGHFRDGSFDSLFCNCKRAYYGIEFTRDFDGICERVLKDVNKAFNTRYFRGI